MKCDHIKDKCYSLRVQRSVGKSQYVGNILMGKNYIGSDFVSNGIYQNRYIKKYQKKGIQTVKMKFYHPVNPKTTAQLVQQEKMQKAVAYYKNLINQGFFDAQNWPIRPRKRRVDSVIHLFLTNKLELFGLPPAEN